MSSEISKNFWTIRSNREISNNLTFDDFCNKSICEYAQPHGSCNIDGLYKAKIFNNDIFKTIINNDGFDNIIDTLTIDFIRSQHYILSTYLLNFIHGKQELNIMEIGGGFGNMRRILSKYMDINSYTIFDINNCLQFNKSFLKTHSNNYDLVEDQLYLHRGFYNISIDFRETFIDNFLEKKNIDVLIATHSLSELDIDEFNWYFDNIVKKSKIFFYCTQTLDTVYNLCGADLSLLKIEKIKEYMNTVLEIGQPGEERNCKMYLFESKKS